MLTAKFNSAATTSTQPRVPNEFQEAMKQEGLQNLIPAVEDVLKIMNGVTSFHPNTLVENGTPLEVLNIAATIRAFELVSVDEIRMRLRQCLEMEAESDVTKGDDTDLWKNNDRTSSTFAAQKRIHLTDESQYPANGILSGMGPSRGTKQVVRLKSASKAKAKRDERNEETN